MNHSDQWWYCFILCDHKSFCHRLQPYSQLAGLIDLILGTRFSVTWTRYLGTRFNNDPQAPQSPFGLRLISSFCSLQPDTSLRSKFPGLIRGNASVVAAVQSCSSFLLTHREMARLSRPSVTVCKFPAHRNYAVTRVSPYGIRTRDRPVTNPAANQNSTLRFVIHFTEECNKVVELMELFVTKGLICVCVGWRTCESIDMDKRRCRHR